MQKRMNILMLFPLIISLLLAITGCGPSVEETGTIISTTAPEETEVQEPTPAHTEEGEPSEPSVIRFGWKGEPDCMTNIYTCGTIYELSDLIHEGANVIGPGCIPFVPSQAKSVDITNEGKTFTFNLWEGMTWSDGEPFTAEDMKLHWDWIQDKSISDWYWITSKAVDWRVIDDLTFELTLSEPESSFLTSYTLWNYVLPPQIYGDFTEEDIFTYATDNPVTTGPYELVEWERGSYMIFDARPDYYRGKPPIDRIVVQFFSNEDGMVSALQAGDIDVIAHHLSPQYYDTLITDSNVTVWSMPPGMNITLDFNLRAPERYPDIDGFGINPAIRDPVVREAIDYAIDKQQIVDVGLLGHGYVCPTAFTCGPLTGHLVKPDIKLIPQDFDIANQLLDEAGYLDTDGDGVRESPEGIPLVFTLNYDVSDSSKIPMSQMIEDWTEDIGIDIETEGMEYATLMNRQVFTGEYEIAIRTWVNEFDPAVMRDLYSCDAGMPFTGWCSENFEEALYNVQTTFGVDRDPYTHEINKAFHDERPYIILAGAESIGGFLHDRIELPLDACPYLGGLLSRSAILDAVVK